MQLLRLLVLAKCMEKMRPPARACWRRSIKCAAYAAALRKVKWT